MELCWFEDLLEIVATRNFSTAANARNISQPSFSRHIVALEKWMKVELIDRRTYPVQLTKAGELFLPLCREIVRDIYRARTDCQQRSFGDKELISFAAFHTIGLFFFPDWIEDIESEHGIVHSSMYMNNFYECVEQLTMGKCDFTILYKNVAGPAVLQDGPFESITIGHEMQIPVSGTDENGQAIFQFSKPGGDKIPYLSYSWDDGYMGRMLSTLQSKLEISDTLLTVYETSMAEGIKRMAIAGRGIGWLPLSCAIDAIKRGDLCQIGDEALTFEMDICIFRRKGSDDDALNMFWENVKNQAAQNNR